MFQGFGWFEVTFGGLEVEMEQRGAMGFEKRGLLQQRITLRLARWCGLQRASHLHLDGWLLDSLATPLLRACLRLTCFSSRLHQHRHQYNMDCLWSSKFHFLTFTITNIEQYNDCEECHRHRHGVFGYDDVAATVLSWPSWLDFVSQGPKRFYCISASQEQNIFRR